MASSLLPSSCSQRWSFLLWPLAVHLFPPPATRPLCWPRRAAQRPPSDPPPATCSPSLSLIWLSSSLACCIHSSLGSLATPGIGGLAQGPALAAGPLAPALREGGGLTGSTGSLSSQPSSLRSLAESEPRSSSAPLQRISFTWFVLISRGSDKAVPFTLDGYRDRWMGKGKYGFHILPTKRTAVKLRV